jgi:hypothetical protein
VTVKIGKSPLERRDSSVHEGRDLIYSEPHPRIRSVMPPKLTDMSTWTGRTGKDGLRSFPDEDGRFWLEQNATKTSKWAKLAGKGHDVAWEFGANRRYTGRMLVDGEILTPSEATKKFLTAGSKTSSK